MANKIIINGRFSYAHLLEPVAPVEGQDPVYSLSLIISKDQKEDIELINKALKDTYKEQGDKLKGNSKNIPSFESIRTPLRDGDKDRPEDEAYQNSYFINLKSRTAPGIVDKACKRISDPEQVYSGCYGRVSVQFFCYCVNGNKGIGAALQNVQVLRDGERLGGKSTPEDDFADSIPEAEDFLS